MSINVISFSLWGDKPLYTFGAVENARLAKIYYPDWQCRFYVDPGLSKEIISQIEDNGAKVLYVEYKPEIPCFAYFWRFLVNDDPDVDRYIIRDSDCRIGPREVACVNEWMGSDKNFHTIHDHFYHTGVPILAGMWGGRTNKILNIGEKIEEWYKVRLSTGRVSKFGDDQKFLDRIIWPLIKDDCFRHDNGYQPVYGKCNRIPKHDPHPFGGTFIGEIFDINNNSTNPQPYSSGNMLW